MYLVGTKYSYGEMLSDSHVSESKIIVGLHDSVIWSSSGFLLLIDWKFKFGQQ
jgi:hypothetical protein